MILADTFSAVPFQSEDDIAFAKDRRCPFFLRFRDSDPHPPCASAGVRLSKSEEAKDAGIYYEQADGT